MSSEIAKISAIITFNATVTDICGTPSVPLFIQKTLINFVIGKFIDRFDGPIFLGWESICHGEPLRVTPHAGIPHDATDSTIGVRVLAISGQLTREQRYAHGLVLRG